ncbi:MAG TPA: alanine racemase, partial [Vicinamibacteria bacterium]
MQANPSRTPALATPPDAEDALGAPDLVRAEPRLGRFRPTFAVVDLGRLAHNFRTLAARVGGEVAQIPVVKADGYGHGSIPVA